MAGDQQQAADGGVRAFDLAGGIVGILVFLAGIAMMVIVFTWVRGVFDSVDAQVQQVRTARAQAAAAEREAQMATASETPAGVPAQSSAQSAVVATPQQGPTIADVGVTIALKMLGLLVLGWLGALVASKGAQLAGAHRGKRD
ncbi:MAG: hypothetical protein AB7Y46_02250 [Armatimonadota bacterium]